MGDSGVQAIVFWLEGTMMLCLASHALNLGEFPQSSPQRQGYFFLTKNDGDPVK